MSRRRSISCHNGCTAYPPASPGLWPVFVTASPLSADPEREQQQHEPDHCEQAEKEQQIRAHKCAEPRRAIGAAQLAIHVEWHIEHREKDREIAEDGQVQKPHDHEQQQHERNRVSDEDEMVISVESAAERKQQPHEGQRQRDQRPSEFIGVRLEFVEHQRGVREGLFEPMVDEEHPRIDLVARDEVGARRHLLDRIFENGRTGSAVGGTFLLAAGARDAEIAGAFLEDVAFGFEFAAPGGGQIGLCEFGVDPVDLDLHAVLDRRGARLLGSLLRYHLAEAAAAADHREHRIGQEDREQEQRERRNEARTLAVNIAPRQVARPPGQKRQRVPDLALEMEDRVDEVVPDRAEAAVDIGALSAMVAMRTRQAGAAIEAAQRRMAVRFALAVARFDRARREARRHRAADTLDIPCHGALPKDARGAAQRGFRELRKTW